MDIGLDIDGVIADLMGPTLKLAREMFGVEIQREELTHYGSLPELSEGRISRSMMYSLFDLAWADYHSMPLQEEGIRGIVEEVRKKKHTVTIISHRSIRSQSNCLRWLNKMVIDYDCVIFPDHNISKFLYPWNLIVDDHPRMPVQARDYPQKRVLFRRQPWNRSVNSLPENVTSIESLREVLDYV